MVPVVSSNSSQVLRDLYATLVQQIKLRADLSVEGAFTAWMTGLIDESAKIESLDELSVSNYHHVSIVAFLWEIDPATNCEPFLTDGLSRVAGRTITILDSEPAPFRHDAVALIGLALGAKRIGGDIEIKVREWMQTFIKPGDRLAPAWKRVLYFTTLSIVGAPVDLRDLDGLSECRDLQLSFISKGIDIFGKVDIGLAYQEICQRAIKEDSEQIIAACSLVALNYLAKSSTVSMNKPTIQELMQLLSRISSGLKRWPWEDKPLTRTSSAQKWDIQNEYHVQSLLYSLLAPIFPDIEDEFYLDPVGQLNPRADIGLPSLSVIIEIKFLRSRIPIAKIVEEIAADASLYFKKDSVFAKKYSQMIIFLWDDSARTQLHHEFNKGVQKLSNIAGSVAISRPGNMTSLGRNAPKKIKKR